MSSFRNLKGFDAGPLAAALAAAGMLACSGFLYSALITNALRSNALAAGGSAVGNLNGASVETATRGDCANAVCLADNWQGRQ
jgi:hypothetical protein